MSTPTSARCGGQREALAARAHDDRRSSGSSTRLRSFALASAAVIPPTSTPPIRTPRRSCPTATGRTRTRPLRRRAAPRRWRRTTSTARERMGSPMVGAARRRGTPATGRTGTASRSDHRAADKRRGMSNSGRPSLRQRLFGVGLQGRLMMAVAAMVLLAGGFLTYRAIAAISDAYRWTAEAEAASIARAYAFGLTPADLASEAQPAQARAPRLTRRAPRPDRRLDRAGRPGDDAGAAGPRTATRGRCSSRSSTATARRRRARARFRLDERAAARAAGRREVLLAGVGRRAAAAHRPRAPRRAAGRRTPSSGSRAPRCSSPRASPARALRWRRRDAVGVLAGSVDALGGTMRALQARIDGLDRKDPLTGVLNHRGLHDALHETLETAPRPGREGRASSSSTSTTSSRSTTRAATPPATRRCGSPRA